MGLTGEIHFRTALPCQDSQHDWEAEDGQSHVRAHQVRYPPHGGDV